MVKLILNITDANGDEQYKDNHINITQCFESNKDRILDLAERNYENLVEALANDAVSKAGASPSNPTLSLPSSSFLRPSDQSDTYKVEMSEIFHNSKGYITE